jgi:hypothetical protein
MVGGFHQVAHKRLLPVPAPAKGEPHFALSHFASVYAACDTARFGFFFLLLFFLSLLTLTLLGYCPFTCVVRCLLLLSQNLQKLTLGTESP